MGGLALVGFHQECVPVLLRQLLALLPVRAEASSPGAHRSSGALVHGTWPVWRRTAQIRTVSWEWGLGTMRRLCRPSAEGQWRPPCTVATLHVATPAGIPIHTHRSATAGGCCVAPRMHSAAPPGTSPGQNRCNHFICHPPSLHKAHDAADDIAVGRTFSATCEACQYHFTSQ